MSPVLAFLLSIGSLCRVEFFGMSIARFGFRIGQRTSIITKSQRVDEKHKLLKTQNLEVLFPANVDLSHLFCLYANQIFTGNFLIISRKVLMMKTTA